MLLRHTVPVSEFFPFILSHIDGVDTNLLHAYVMNAIKKFIHDTKLLTEIVCIPLEKCQNSYRIPTDYRFYEVLSVRFFSNGVLLDSDPISYYINDGVLYVNGECCIDGLVVEIEATVVPRRKDTEVPEFLYEDWVDAITHAVLAQLYLMSEAEWANGNAANTHLQLYRIELAKAKTHRFTKHRPLNIKLIGKRR